MICLFRNNQAKFNVSLIIVLVYNQCFYRSQKSVMKRSRFNVSKFYFYLRIEKFSELVKRSFQEIL